MADLRVATEVARFLSYQVVWMQSKGKVPNHEASMSKAFGSELGQRIANFGLRMIGLAQQMTRTTRAPPMGEASAVRTCARCHRRSRLGRARSSATSSPHAAWACPTADLADPA